MQPFRPNPYSHENYLIEIEEGGKSAAAGGFQEISGAWLPGAEIRGGLHAGDVTLKRGIINSGKLSEWLDDGETRSARAHRTVRIHRRKADRSGAAQTWTLRRARIIKHTSGPLNAKGTDVAMEELVVAYERLDLD